MTRSPSPDLGVDLSARGGDLDPTFGLVAGPACVAEHQGRRLLCDGVWYDADYEAVDLRAALSAGLDGADVVRLRARVERALRQDERVEDCDVDLTFLPSAGAITVAAEGVTAAGPFRLVVSSAAASAAILEARAT